MGINCPPKTRLRLAVRKMHWTPNDTHEWTPTGGWNVAYGEREKMRGIAYHHHLIRRGYSENAAEIIIQMVLSKQVYDGLTYSDAQEKILRKAIYKA